MAAVSLSQIVILYAWFPLALILLFLLLIARFYERSANERTFFGYFGVPIGLFGAGLIRYASVNAIAGDVLGDMLVGIGGLLLILLCLFLYHLMTRNR
ncbi:MAG: hypothetical protein JNJ61_25940 [Anaerolineae bacterium]|nr:hypothetical protein [Anaerolineae bacterium]